MANTKAEISYNGAYFRDIGTGTLLAKVGDVYNEEEVQSVALQLEAQGRTFDNYAVGVQFSNEEGEFWEKVVTGPEWMTPWQIAAKHLDGEQQRWGDEYIEINDVFSP